MVGRDSRTARSRGGEHCDWASARRRLRRAGGRPGGNPTRRCGSGSRGDGDEPEQQAQREEGRHVEAAVGARGGSGARPRAARTHGSPAEGIVSPAELVSGTVRVRPTRYHHERRRPTRRSPSAQAGARDRDDTRANQPRRRSATDGLECQPPRPEPSRRSEREREPVEEARAGSAEGPHAAGCSLLLPVARKPG